MSISNNIKPVNHIHISLYYNGKKIIQTYCFVCSLTTSVTRKYERWYICIVYRITTTLQMCVPFLSSFLHNIEQLDSLAWQCAITYGNIFVVNKCWWPPTSFVVIKRLTSVIKPLPLYAHWKYDMHLHHRMLTVS